MGNWERPFNATKLDENLKQFSSFLDSETIKEKYGDSYPYKRLAQAVKYASELLLCFKPELSTLFVLRKLQKASEDLAVLASEERFKLNLANEYIDVMLNMLPRFLDVRLKNKEELSVAKKEITEYLIIKKAEIEALAVEANTAFGQIASAKRDIIDGDEETLSHLDEIESAREKSERYSNNIAEIHKKFEEIEEQSKEAQSALEGIEEAKCHIIDGDGETDSYMKQIKQANEDIRKSCNEAMEFYNRLAGTPAEGTNYKDAVASWVEKIKQDRAEAADSRKDIDGYYVVLFGKKMKKVNLMGELRQK